MAQGRYCEEQEGILPEGKKARELLLGRRKSIRHPNLVSLKGYYWGQREHERLLISDCIDALSLTVHLCAPNTQYPRSEQPSWYLKLGVEWSKHRGSSSSPAMLLLRFYASLARTRSKCLVSKFAPKPSSRLSLDRNRLPFLKQKEISGNPLTASASRSDDMRRRDYAPLPPASADKAELLKGLEATLGSPFSSEPLSPPPNPMIIVISGPSGVGKDAVIKRLKEVREGIHFVVTATSRRPRPGELDGEDYYFVSKEEFLSMMERNELLEYALVYGEYKGIPKQQIRDFMAKGYDIVLRVDVQGAATLRSMLGDSAIFVFLVAESEEVMVRRLVDRKTETSEMLLVRIATAREEVKCLRDFDYVVVNAEGELDAAVKLVESIIDAEKARVRQRFVRL